MNCLIVAAGTGGRLRERGQSKPLVPVNGVGLLERVIMRARGAGVQHFLVVSGYRGADVRAALDALSVREGISITHVVNDEWQRGNGVSVSKARPFAEALPELAASIRRGRGPNKAPTKFIRKAISLIPLESGSKSFP